MHLARATLARNLRLAAQSLDPARRQLAFARLLFRLSLAIDLSPSKLPAPPRPVTDKLRGIFS